MHASASNGLLGSSELRFAIGYAKEYLKRLTFQDSTAKRKKKFYVPHFDLDDKNDQYTSSLIKFHQKLLEGGAPSIGIMMHEKVKVVKMYNKLLEKLP